MRLGNMALLVAGLVVAGCAGGEAPSSGGGQTASSASDLPAIPSTAAPLLPATTVVPAPATTVVPPPALPLEGLALRMALVATLDQPVAMAVRGGDPALYIAEKTGRVRALRDGRVDPTPVLDLSGAVSSGYEQGLLGLTFSPDGRRLYVDYTDSEGDTRVVEFDFSSGRADRESSRELLFVEQPYDNHNGGQVSFGPDGHLYVALGDGGSGGDPANNAQNLGVLLGKILRLNPRPGEGRPYTIPGDNPFVSDRGARPEVWAFGLRNPWRFSFDRATGDLWTGDVGQNRYEEVDFVTSPSASGANYGWDRLEGLHPFEGEPPARHVPPIHEYRLTGASCAVTGGYVYRGQRIPGLVGTYLFADFCDGQVIGLRQQAGKAVEVRPLGISAPQLTSFGEDLAGELYVLSLSGGLFRVEPA
ncbi:MAG: PQQ-dependent sugar dehydrogenase [Acidimicrobiia bacterium]